MYRNRCVDLELRMWSRGDAILQPKPQLFPEPFEVDRLRQASYAASLQDPFLLCCESVSRYRDYRNFCQRGFLAHPCDEVETIFGVPKQRLTKRNMAEFITERW